MTAGTYIPCASRPDAPASRPCWAVSRERIIMPAGTYTGGLDVRDPALADELIGPKAYFATTTQGVIALDGATLEIDR